jgi:hypothetical protein
MALCHNPFLGNILSNYLIYKKQADIHLPMGTG